MPFGDGITIAASNRGKRPIANVGVSVSFEPASDATREDILGRMRLHAAFQPAGDGSELVRLNGPGRWVGSVFQRAADAAMSIDELRIDGRPASGWASADLATLLGQADRRGASHPAESDVARAGDRPQPGAAGGFHPRLSGRRGTLCWRYLMLDPVDFRESLVLKTNAQKLGPSVAIYYAAP
jgi:hypothetical protein